MKRRARDQLLHLLQRSGEAGNLAERGAVVGIVHVYDPPSGNIVRADVEDRAVKIVAWQPRMWTRTRHEKKHVQWIVDRGCAVFGAVVRGFPDNGDAKTFRTVAVLGGQRLHVAGINAGARFESFWIDLTREQFVEVRRKKSRAGRKRAGGDMATFVVSIGIRLMRSVETRDGIDVSRSVGHRSNWAVLDQVENGLVELSVGVLGHKSQ